MGKAQGYVSAGFLRDAARALEHLKQRSYELMRVERGHCVLDLGCGPGLDTVPLAEMVGPTGSVTGVDLDDEMLAEADALARDKGVYSWVVHRAGDATALPFPDGSFDAARAERLLQVLPPADAPGAVVRELHRVTKPGGWVVLADTDWATASVDFPDSALERRLLTFFADRLRPNGYAGRQLFQLLGRQGFAEVRIETFPLVQAELAKTPFGDWLCDAAREAGVATADELHAWRSHLQTRSAEGTFYSSVNMVLVAGQRR